MGRERERYETWRKESGSEYLVALSAQRGTAGGFRQLYSLLGQLSMRWDLGMGPGWLDSNAKLLYSAGHSLLSCVDPKSR